VQLTALLSFSAIAACLRDASSTLESLLDAVTIRRRVGREAITAMRMADTAAAGSSE